MREIGILLLVFVPLDVLLHQGRLNWAQTVICIGLVILGFWLLRMGSDWKEGFKMGTIISLAAFGVAVYALSLWGKKEKKSHEESESRQRPQKAA